MNETARLRRLYIDRGLSIREVAAVLGLSEATIRRRLKAAGIPARSMAKRSRLRTLDQARLFADIAELGVDKTAKKWGIFERTLKRYLAGLRRAAKSE